MFNSDLHTTRANILITLNVTEGKCFFSDNLKYADV